MSFRSRIFWTLLGGYASYYLCRVNLAIAQPDLAAEFHWDKAEVGTIASSYYLVYAIGKLISGVAADRLGGRLLFLLGALGSAATNLCFPLATTLSGMTALWSVNAFFQSMGWSALVSIMSRWYGAAEQGAAMGYISTSYQLGNAAAWGVLKLLLLFMPWTALFTLPAVAFAVLGLASYVLLRNDPRDVGLPSPHRELNVDAAAAAAAELEGKAAAREIVRRTLLSPYLWAICLISLLLTFVRYTFINWAPSYVAERAGEAAAAGGKSQLAMLLELVAFPLIGCAGSMFTGWFSDRVSGSRRAPVIALTCAGLAATLVAFGFAGGAPTPVVVTLLSLAGFMLYGPYALLAGAIAIDLGSRHAAATAAGIIDAVGYLGAVLSGAGMGWLIDRVGWEQSFLVLAGAAGACVVVAVLLWRVRPAAAPAPAADRA